MPYLNYKNVVALINTVVKSSWQLTKITTKYFTVWAGFATELFLSLFSERWQNQLSGPKIKLPT